MSRKRVKSGPCSRVGFGAQNQVLPLGFKFMGPLRPIGNPFRGAPSPRHLGAAPFTQMRAPLLPATLGAMRGPRLRAVKTMNISGPSCRSNSITRNAQSPGQLQTPFFIMIFFP